MQGDYIDILPKYQGETGQRIYIQPQEPSDPLQKYRGNQKLIRYYEQKDIMLITDFPLVKEAESGNAFSENSSTQLKDALIRASVLECKNREKKHTIGTNEICLTHLSLERPEKGDSDWSKSLVNKKQIPVGEEEDYVQLEWLKDIWVTQKLAKSINGLLEQIRRVSPRLVILAGKWSFLLLASLVDKPDTQLATIAATRTTFKKQVFFGALNKYRASLLTFHEAFNLPSMVVMPILTPAYHWAIRDKHVIVQRDYGKIASYYRRLREGETVEDILRSQHTLSIGFTEDSVLTYLRNLLAILDTRPVKLVSDVETRQGFIDCIGLCYEAGVAFTIPFTELYIAELLPNEEAYAYKTISGKKTLQLIELPVGTMVTKYRHYWNIDEEVSIMDLLQKVFLHPNCLHVGQNLSYDLQFYYREWYMSLQTFADTMVQHHVLWNYLPKDLAMLASMYCKHYVYYKDEIHGGGQGA